MSGFNWDWTYAASVMPALLEGLLITVQATILGSILAVSLGLVWTIVRLAGIPVVSPVISFMVEFLRGTPFLIQLYLFFYVLPNYGLLLSPLLTGIIALGLYGSAKMAEIYRAGIEAVPAGQWEASLVLGLPIRRVWLGVILPQVSSIITPMTGNVIIVMFKDSALLSTITVLELVAQARNAGLATFRYLEPLTLAGILFWIVSYTAARMIRAVERRTSLDPHS